jgi:Beta-propeller repeat
LQEIGVNPRSALFAALVFSASAAYSQVVTRAVALDSNGNEYLIGLGLTPTPGAAQTQAGGGLCQRLESGPRGVVGTHPILAPCVDAEIAKRDPSGNVIFSTLLGGSTDDTASAIAIDSEGFTYIAGSTGGSFPVTANAALATIPANGSFAAKLSSDGSKFIYATYLPTTVQTVAAIAADANGNAYVTGRTQSGHAFAIRISADGSSFVCNQIISISQIENGTAIAVDASGNAAVAGWTKGATSPPQNVFFTKLDAAGTMIATNVLPGSGLDTPNAIQSDAAGNVYIAGATTSTDFPATPGTFETASRLPSG